MTKLTPYLLVTALLYLNLAARAQTDSGYADLGRVKLNTGFIQTITIQGSDLERMPFLSLDEAINVYLYGNNTSPNPLVYIINGNLVGDVNAYSVYDIETVTLVQNALSNVNGATNTQRLVLIKTRSGKEQPAGFTAAGSSYLLGRREAGDAKNIKSPSSPDFFHQYYLSGRTRIGRSVFGGSAGWLRDITPLPETEYSVKGDPHRLNRLRFNAWFNTRIWGHSNFCFLE